MQALGDDPVVMLEQQHQQACDDIHTGESARRSG